MKLNAFHDGIPNVCDLHDLPFYHGRDGRDDALHGLRVLCSLCDLRHSDVYRGDPFCHNGPRDVRSDDDLLSYDVPRVCHGDHDAFRAYGVCLLYGDHHKSDGPCDIHPYGIFYGNHRSLHLCRNVFCDDAYHLCDDGRVRDVCHGDHLHPSAFYDRLRAHDDVLHDGAYDDRRVHLCGGDDDLYDLCGPFHHVRDGGVRGALFHRPLRGDDLCGV
ncbi:unnamed protein product [Pieris brassicae]|uniref:Uncharacterized protein n=1 Tax=Pieris brassicae TaxID=7116 RepID=A0A9P0TX48_PIEBR|nr:unnamed protein product [Pieris brassicae]